MSGGRKKRPLRVNAPTVHPLGRGEARSLVRYEGGSQGPVLLTAAADVSAGVFTLDTIDTNLLEFLFGRSFDVWLLDSSDAGDRDAAIQTVKETARAARVHVFPADWNAPALVATNAATRDVVPESWRHVPIIGQDSVRKVYPAILDEIRRHAAAAGA